MKLLFQIAYVLVREHNKPKRRSRQRSIQSSTGKYKRPQISLRICRGGRSTLWRMIMDSNRNNRSHFQYTEKVVSLLNEFSLQNYSMNIALRKSQKCTHFVLQNIVMVQMFCIFTFIYFYPLFFGWYFNEDLISLNILD